MTWRIWFDDGQHVDVSDEAEWNAAPNQGVQIVKGGASPKHYLYHMGLDYYFFEDGDVKSCNRMDIDRYLIRPGGIRNVKLGRWSSNHVWERVHEEAKKHQPCKDCD